MTSPFGTDGVRGDAARDLPDDFVEALSCAAAEVLGAQDFAVGCDPRSSSPRLVEAVSRGVRAANGSPLLLGVVPTPAVALLCAQREVAGAMVSASHNPWHDNGVKFFARGGLKLSDEQQARVESRLASRVKAPEVAATEASRAHDEAREALESGWQSERQRASEASRAHDEAREGHVRSVMESLHVAADGAPRDLRGLKLVVDCANGAASESGPECLRRLGADVVAVNDSPDGRNINLGCGSLHPGGLQEAVKAHQADAGIAFDGDADRVLAVDHRGELIDGDQILAVCAIDRQARGLLKGDAVVVTVMANLGLRLALQARGIAIIETPVGDRHVLKALEEHGLVLGGEQSGHLIFRDLAVTGCGLLTAVQLLDAVKRADATLRELAGAAMTRLPQILENVSLADPTARARVNGRLAGLEVAAARRLGDQGRVLLRMSGTEPVVRVMVESVRDAIARSEAQRLVAEVERALS